MSESLIKKARILLADDHPLLRKSLRLVIETDPELEVIGEAGNGLEAVRMCQAYEPDIVIMDIAMPVMDGVTATRRIKATQPLVAVLVLTVHTDTVTIFEILRAGASGYLVKSIFGSEVVSTIRTILNGEMVLAPEVSQEILKYALRGRPRPVEPQFTGLVTQRELEVLALAAKGMANKEIARQIGVSEGTIKNYFVGLFQKLGVRSRTEAIFVGLKLGILSVEDLE